MKSFHFGHIVMACILLGSVMHIRQLRHRILQHPSRHIYFAQQPQPLPPRDYHLQPLKVRGDDYREDFHGVVKYTALIPLESRFIPFALAYARTRLLSLPIITVVQQAFLKACNIQLRYQDNNETIYWDAVPPQYQQALTRALQPLRDLAQRLYAAEILITDITITPQGFYRVLRITAKLK